MSDIKQVSYYTAQSSRAVPEQVFFGSFSHCLCGNWNNIGSEGTIQVIYL